MNTFLRNAHWLLFGSAVFLAAVAALIRLSVPGASAQTPCPLGQAPLQNVALAELLLPSNPPPGAKIALSQITLAPGESLDPAASPYTAYHILSGVLQFRFQPWTTIMRAPKCATGDGFLASGGVTTVDANGMASVAPGESLVTEDIRIGAVTNGSSQPLVMLVMTLVPAQIDPTTGLPIVDPGTAGRASAKAFEQQKQACKAGISASPEAEQTAAPAMSTAGWEVESGRETGRVPRACRK
jgi:hypothetical protein